MSEPIPISDPAADPLDNTRRYWNERLHGDPTHFFAMASLMRLSRRVTRTIDSTLSGHALGRNAYLLLMTLELSPNGSRILGALARDLLVHPTTITLTIDRLEELGLVKKTPHESDRRAMRAQITEEGRTLARKITGELAEVGFGFDGLSASQTGKLNTTITAARRVIGDFLQSRRRSS